MKPWKRYIFVLFLLSPIILFSLVQSSSSFAKELIPREYLLKSSFILKFSEFVHWPNVRNSSNAKQKLIICSKGHDPFANLFNLARQESIIEKKLVIMSKVSLKQTKSCNILYISNSEKDHLEEILEAIKNQPILVIGDTYGFAERGVGINFVIIGNKIQFEVNRKAIERAGLKISSELLNLAILVD